MDLFELDKPMKNIRYIFHKGHVLGHAKLEFMIAKIYLEDPIRYGKDKQ